MEKRQEQEMAALESERNALRARVAELEKGEALTPNEAAAIRARKKERQRILRGGE